MQRWDIINYFIKKNGYKSYLEIGYYKGWSFDQVICDSKTAVDPFPCKYSYQAANEYKLSEIENCPGGYWNNPPAIIAAATSDEFFSIVPEGKKWDIVFIDGLHEANQVYRDIQNALKHLSDNGVIVLHDCNPPKYEHTTTGIDGCWTGDTYKGFLKFKYEHQYHTYFTIDTDWGVSVIKLFKTPAFILFDSFTNPYAISWDYFDQNRKELLNLISVEEFLKRES